MLALCKCQCPKALGGRVHGMDALAEMARSMWRGMSFPTGVSWKPRMVISERRTLNWRARGGARRRAALRPRKLQLCPMQVRSWPLAFLLVNHLCVAEHLSHDERVWGVCWYGNELAYMKWRAVRRARVEEHEPVGSNVSTFTARSRWRTV